jgi:iron complex transport system ATP-binding protein
MDYVLSSLSIGYKKKVVATDINKTLCAGTMTCLIGRNGTGKSTLMRTMAGFQPPLGGSLSMDGRDVTQMTTMERARLVSVVLTDRVDVQGMTVTDLVSMGRQPYTGFFGKMTKDDEAIVAEALQQVGMADFAGRQVTTLSDGERQKVMIAKALAQQTPFILLDEPTAFLDYPSKKETLSLLLQLCHEEQKAVLVSTHDLDVALKITDEVWEMEKI